MKDKELHEGARDPSDSKELEEAQLSHVIVHRFPLGVTFMISIMVHGDHM